MSDSYKGSKPPGYEYWSARPGNRYSGTVGKATKKNTHRAERRQGKAESKLIPDSKNETRHVITN